MLSIHVIHLLTILLQHEEQSGSGSLGTPLWLPIFLLVLMFLLFWWGLSRAGVGQTAVPHDSHDSHAEHKPDVAAMTQQTTPPPVVAPRPPVVASPPPPPPPKPIPDNLKKIEGIGPKIEKILNTAGIYTYAQLAATSVAQLEKIVREDAGITVAFPDTWPEQARLAAEGNWTAFEQLTKDLKGGRRA